MNKKSFVVLLLLIVVSLPAVWQIITPGYFPIHDNTQVVRVQQMNLSLKSGQFPVRWVPDLGYGYGYPIFNFYNPLPYYFGGGLMFFGISALTATKIMMIFPVILSAITMFILARSILPFWISIITSILFLYAPYHGVQIYVRGAVAESWAYALLPIVIWAISKNKKIWGGIFLSTLILSHNLTALMIIPFIAILFLVQCFKTLNQNKNSLKSLITNYLFLITISLGLSAFFWLPSITQLKLTQVSEMVFYKFDSPARHLLQLKQLWYSPWGYGGSSPGTDDGFSLQLGKIHLLGSFAFIVSLIYYRIVKKKSLIKQFNSLTVFSIISLIISIFIMLPYSAPIWQQFSLLNYIQFPWRFLTFASLFSSLLTAYLISIILKYIKNTKIKSSILVTCILLLLTYSNKFFQPQYKFPTTTEALISRDRIVWEVSSRSDEYLPLGFQTPLSFQQAQNSDNPQNQVLVDRLNLNTPIRRLANYISLITFIYLILHALHIRLTQPPAKLNQGKTAN